MRCPSCHHDNRSDRRFCTQCGTKLVGCPSCGAPIEVGEKFCGGCGAALTIGGADDDSIASYDMRTENPRVETPGRRSTYFPDKPSFAGGSCLKGD